MASLRLPILAFVVATLLYTVVTPPFAASDEAAHFNKAVQYSELMLANVRQGDNLGGMLPAWVDDLEHNAFPNEMPGVAEIYRPADIAAAWRRSDPGGRRFADFSMIAAYPPTLYVPQVIGIAVARAVGMPALGRFYAARLANALVLIGLALLSVRIIPLGRPVIVALLAFPMVAHQAGSCSSDVTVIGLSLLAIAATLRLASDSRGLWLHLALLPVFVLLGLAKGVYLLVALAGLALRPRRWEAIWLLFCVGVAAACFVLWNAANGGNIIRQSVVDRMTLLHAMTALPQEQLAFALQHPVSTTRAIMTSLVVRSPVYVAGMIGRFGWFAVTFPLPLYALALAVFIGGLFHPQPGTPRPRTAQRLFWLMLAVIVTVLVEFALYLVATPLGAGYVLGTQGRYFLPCLPLFGLALAMPTAPDGRVGRAISLAFAPAVLVLAMGGLLTSLLTFWRFD